MRVAIEKVDDDLLANARQRLGAELPSCPPLRDANPTSVVATLEPIARLLTFFVVPRKPYPHPTEAVGEDPVRVRLDAVLAYHHRDVRAVDDRLEPRSR